MINVTTKGAVLLLDNDTKVVVLDSYAISTKRVRITTITENLCICFLIYNLETNEVVKEHSYDAVIAASILRQYEDN